MHCWRRARGLPARAERWLPQVPGRYMVCMWQANLARYWRRCQRMAEAQTLFQACVEEAESQGWHAVRRPAQLELALMAECGAELDQARALLLALFEPEALRVRDVVALPAYRAMGAGLPGPGPGARPPSRPGVSAVPAMWRASRPAWRLPFRPRAWHPCCWPSLAAAERQRVETEIKRLRAEQAAGAMLRLPDGEAWFKADMH